MLSPVATRGLSYAKKGPLPLPLTLRFCSPPPPCLSRYTTLAVSTIAYFRWAHISPPSTRAIMSRDRQRCRYVLGRAGRGGTGRVFTSDTDTAGTLDQRRLYSGTSPLWMEHEPLPVWCRGQLGVAVRIQVRGGSSSSQAGRCPCRLLRVCDCGSESHCKCNRHFTS